MRSIKDIVRRKINPSLGMKGRKYHKKRTRGRPSESTRIVNDGRYRYSLTRTWNRRKRRVAWIILHPAYDRDFTTSKIVRLSKQLGYGSCTIVAIFAHRAIDRAHLAEFDDPVGPHNLRHISLQRHYPIICAWGARGDRYHARVFRTLAVLRFKRLHAWRLASNQHPMHVAAIDESLPLKKWKIDSFTRDGIIKSRLTGPGMYTKQWTDEAVLSRIPGDI